jgi:pimeloyl-ACP methyl ester carboxylesterase
MADQQAYRMEGFCLFHSTAYADDENKKLNRTKVMEFVAKNGTPPFVQTLIPSLFSTPNNRNIEPILEEASQTNPKTVIGYARAMRDRADMTKVYPVFRHPILFFAGMKDSVIPPESITKQAAEARDEKIFYLEDVAHMGMLESPAATQSMLLDFLRDSL